MASIRYALGYTDTYTPMGKPIKDKSFLAFVHSLPCVVTGQRLVQAAHISFQAPEWGATGRGKGQKASDRWVLPLSPEMHQKQHDMNEEAFWAEQGINPHAVSAAIYGVFKERGPEGLAICEEIIRRAKPRQRANELLLI